MAKRISKARQLTKAKKQKWREEVIAKWKNKCMKCLRTEHLDCHHLSYRKEVKHDSDNGLLLCKKCHKLGSDSCHSGGLEFYNWFIKNYPRLNEKVMEMINEAKEDK